MKKLIITGTFGAMLCLSTGAPADASIVSRGFLDEALTNYATTTALDLKANQSDLTDLSSKIGTLPTTITAEGFSGDYTLPDNIGEQLSIIFYGNNDRINYIAGLMELYQNILDIDTTGPADEIWDSLYNGLEKKLISGAWQEWRGLTEMDANIKNNTAKIGALPDGYESVGAALTAMNAKIDGKISDLSATATNGKYVLTAVKVGDQTTYAWELIDRSESEATTTTE